MKTLLIYLITILYYCYRFCYCYPEYDFGNINPPTSENIQRKAAENVIERLVPHHLHKFTIKVDFNLTDRGKDQFVIYKIDEKIRITASSGVAATWGFHYYIKNYCNAHIGWQNIQLNLPENLPFVDIKIVAQDRFRYYENVCTTSYSFVWWNKEEWRKNIDWIALNGINLALASNGQEAIWKNIYKRFNLTDDEINEHFSGPAFLSWQRMGNIRGWGGPLSENWHAISIELQHFIVDEMRNLGIIPVLPSFSGQVPRGFSRIFPRAKLLPVETWNNFKDSYCCPLFLDPTDPLFQTVGTQFLSEMVNEFGASHVYNSDPFNEIKPPSDDKEFLILTSRSIYQSMRTVDENAIWLLQNWMFVHDPLYWSRDKVEPFLTSIPIGKVLILDLQSEQWPKYGYFDNYFGQPYIWCMLHNFGGTLGMFGSSQIINREVYKARLEANSSMVGIGLTPEGINQNYVIYDLMLESAIRNSSVDLFDWATKYSIRRYGSYNENLVQAWKILITSVYNFKGHNKIRGKYAITKQPNLNYKPWAWYTSKQLLDSWNLLIECDKECESSGYRHDIVDLTRQVLQYRGDQIYYKIIEAFKEKNITSLRAYGEQFLSIFQDLEKLLASNKDFLLGKWINSAKSLSRNIDEDIQYEFNARNQITLWGPNREIVDYAIKQWAGIMSDYLGQRWVYFLADMEKSIVEKTKFNKTAALERIFKIVEQPFTISHKIYPTEPEGDTMKIVHELKKKWFETDDLQNIPVIMQTFKDENAYFADKNDVVLIVDEHAVFLV